MGAESYSKRARVDPAGLILAVAGVGCVLLLLGFDLARAGGRPGLSINGQAIWGRDFVNLWSAGRMVLEGRLGDIYNVAAYQAWQSAALGPGIADHAYSYPPLTLLYAPLFGALPYPVALALWLGLSLALFALAARPWLDRLGLPAWLALVLPSTLLCVWSGHYGLLVGAIWLAAWDRLDRRPRAAGFLIGLLAIKPHLAILLPLVLLRRRAWPAIGSAAITALLLVALSVLLFGLAPWRTYLTTTATLQLGLIGHARDFFSLMMPTLAPTLIAYGAAVGTALAAQAILAAAVIAMLMWRLPEQAHQAALATATATFLILPYAFNYDLTVVGVGALVLLMEASRDRRRLDALLAGAALALPPAMMFLGRMGFRVAPLILALLLWRQLARPQAAAAISASR